MSRHLITVLTILLASTGAAKADQLMSQYPIAVVEAGLDPASKAPVYEMVVAGLTLPEPSHATSTINVLTPLQNCTRNALGVWGHRGTDILDGPRVNKPYDTEAIPRVDTVIEDLAREVSAQPSPTALTVATVTAESKRRIGLIDTWLRSQAVVVRSNLQKYCGDTTVPEVVRNRARLLISLRRCPVPTPSDKYHPCNMKGLEGAGRIRIREYGYAQLLAWTQGQGARPHDEWWDVGAGNPGDVVPAQTTTPPESAAWPQINEPARLQQFEALVDSMRKRKDVEGNQLTTWISSSVPITIGLTQESAARVLDLLQSPMYATSALQRGNQALETISDEVARTRIVECIRLRRVSASDLQAVQTCAGYTATDGDIAKCLTGGRCMPEIAKDAIASVLQITEKFDVTQLAANTRLPRVSDVDFDAWEIAARQCAIDSDKQSQTDKTFQSLSVQCTLNKVLNADSKATLECVNGRKTMNPQELAGCLPIESPMLKCYRDNSNEVGAMALCSAKSDVPTEVLTCIEGYEADRAVDSLQNCALNALGGDAQKVAEMLACASNHHGDDLQAALCMAGPNIPKELRGAAECAQSSSQSFESFAACTALKEVSLGLPGNLGRLASCGIQAQGDPFGTGVCMAGSGLNSSQQILLQCAASSGGEPWTFAGCAGGRLAMQEFIQCKNVKFGDGNCFGKNNEIRRFVRALGLPDISPGSVVGEIANIHLEVIKFQVRFAEEAFDAVGDALAATGAQLEAFGKCLEDFGKSVERSVSDVGKALEKGYKSVGSDLGRTLKKVL